MLHALTLPCVFLCALEYVHIHVHVHVHWSTCMYVMYVADGHHYSAVSGRGLPSCTCYDVHVYEVV